MLKKETFFLKNMIGNSCVKLIELDFKSKKDVLIKHIALGKVTFEYDNEIVNLQEISNYFHELGFGIITDPDVEIVEHIKTAAFELIYKSFNANSLIRNSDYISEKVQLPYDKISRIFSHVTGTKIEKYIILLKMEKAKELLLGNEYTISEIAFMMNYSSVQYFSNQFKKNVGITISKFKESPETYRKAIDQLI